MLMRPPVPLQAVHAPSTTDIVEDLKYLRTAMISGKNVRKLLIPFRPIYCNNFLPAFTLNRASLTLITGVSKSDYLDSRTRWVRSGATQVKYK